jgi:tripartite-type tricarboxylate transporter receptor subunit TctC
MQSLVRIALALFAALAAALPAAAQTYPSRNITIVVGYAPGGTGDFITRVIGNKLAEKFGRTVVVENRAGASGLIAAQFVVNSTPDGYTILAGQTPEIAINPHFLKSSLDVARDLVPIALGGVVPLALVVPKGPGRPCPTCSRRRSRRRACCSPPPAPARRAISPARCSSSQATAP